MKLNNAIQQRSDSYPIEFQQIMTIKINEKVSKINNTISQISPLASQQKISLYSYYKSKNNNNKIFNIINSNDDNYSKFIDNILYNPSRKQINNNQNQIYQGTNNQLNQNINKNPKNQNLTIQKIIIKITMKQKRKKTSIH